MAKPHAFSDAIARTVVIRRLSGQPLKVIATEMRMAYITAYQICEGTIRGHATKDLRLKGKAILKELKTKRTPAKKCQIFHRNNFDHKKMLSEAASLCLNNIVEIRNTSEKSIKAETKRIERLQKIMSIV